MRLQRIAILIVSFFVLLHIIPNLEFGKSTFIIINHPGFVVPYFLLWSAFIIFALLEGQNIKKIASFFNKLQEEAKSTNPIMLNKAFVLLPGYKLIGKSTTEAQEGPTGENTTYIVTAIFILIVIGGTSLPTIKILEAINWLPNSWDSWENMHIWPIAHFGAAFSYCVTSIAINYIVQYAIKAGYETDTSKKVNALVNYFEIPDARIDPQQTFWGEYSDHSTHIYGHKTWASKKIKDMIDAISRKENKLGTSRWFLLDFAAEVMDHAVKKSSEGGSTCIEHTYPNEYHYSLFLANKMNYSRKSMIWITDHRDFVKVILPMLVAETVIGIAALKSTTESPLKKLMEMDSLKDKEFLSQDDNHCINGTCGAFNKHFELNCPEQRNNRCKKRLDDRETGKEFLCRALCLSIINLSDMAEFPDLDKNTFYNEFDDRGTDRWELPHVKVYSRHPVMKSKIINIPNLSNTPNNMFDSIINDLYLYGLDNGEQQSNNIENKDKIKSIVHKALEANFYRILFLSNFNESVEPSLSNKEIHFCIKTLIKDLLDKKNFADNIFYLTCLLYKHTCNSHTNHKLIGFAQLREQISSEHFKRIEDKMFFVDSASDGKEPFWDVGLFDEYIFVSSKENDADQEGSKHRKVKWSYLGEDDYLREKLMKFKPGDQSDSIPDTIKEQFYSLDSFITDYKGKILNLDASD